MSEPGEPGPDDPYSRVDYRRLIAWPERIRREAPFLCQVLGEAPQPSVVDLGCGTGEHSRFLAGEGFRVAGLDSSESMIARAREEPLPENLRLVLGDIREAPRRLEERFGAAICLGNTLVHITEREELERAFAAVAGVLVEGGLFLFQILNYERIFRKKIRNLPLNFREEEGAAIIFLRLMEPLGEGRVRFCPSTLRYDPRRDPPLQVERSRTVELRGWQRDDLVPLLRRAGLGVLQIHGDMEGGVFEPEESRDLVVVAST